MGMNWQFIGKGIPELEWKQKCDLLLPEHGFNTTVKVKFDSSWIDEKQKALDTSILTVDQKGFIHGIKAGEATVTATSTDGSNKTATCTVTVQGTEP